MKNNDEKIIVLKKQIEEKKAKINKSQRFTPITNCSIEVDGVRHNIQVMKKEEILILMVKLNSYVMSAEDLFKLGISGAVNELNISGFNIMDWIKDLKSKLEFMSRKEEENKLKNMENKLDLLLSNEKKTELELDEIENMLK